MGWTSEMVARAYNVSRQKQDEYALISHTRAAKVNSLINLKPYRAHTHCLIHVTQSVKSGIFSEEIIPIEVRGAIISVDDTVRPGVTLESLAGLKPAFLEDGASTAGNSSGIGDGAALCILTSRARAEKEGWEVLGKYVSSAFVGTLYSTSCISSLMLTQMTLQELSHGIWVSVRSQRSRRSWPRPGFRRKTLMSGRSVRNISPGGLYMPDHSGVADQRGFRLSVRVLRRAASSAYRKD